MIRHRLTDEQWELIADVFAPPKRMGRPPRKMGAELLFEVVSRAYERTSLIVTTNLPFEAWMEVMGNQRLTGALLDRLTHRVHILEANGESYRLRQSRQRLRHERPERVEIYARLDE